MIEKPVCQPCIRNQDVILSQLKEILCDQKRVLEIGSGTGQHAVHFATHLPNLYWQTSDLAINHGGINAWIDEADLENCGRPFEFDITSSQWPEPIYDAIYTANTLHICSWSTVALLFQNLRRSLKAQGLMIIYGPFNYAGEFTSEGNRNFDAHLRSSNPEQGIRDIEAVNQLAIDNGLTLVADNAMPANNRLLVFRVEQALA